MILTRPAEHTMQDMLDRSSVKGLLEFERFCRDSTLWDEMKRCYTNNSRANISRFQGSGHGFVDASCGACTRSRHPRGSNRCFAGWIGTCGIRHRCFPS